MRTLLAAALVLFTRTALAQTDAHAVGVYLHGMCGGPEGGCGYFLRGLGTGAEMICPRAPAPCPGGGSQWTGGSTASSVVTRAFSAANAGLPAPSDASRRGVLIGFSQGSYVVRTILRASPGRWHGAVFIAGFIRLHRADLERAGVRRAVFAAGRYDMTRRTLAETARTLQAEGYPARFVDLGPVGHTFVAARESDGWREALAWVAGGVTSPADPRAAMR